MSEGSARTPHVGVILAAGAGSRLGELGKRQSKAMLRLAGRPLIAHVIERLQAAGIAHLVVVRHVDDAALAAFLAGAQPSAIVGVQHERRGIADALAVAVPLLGDAPAYLACACDSLFDPTDIAAVIEAGRDGAAVVGVLAMGAAATATRSAVLVDGDRVTALIEKPPPGSVATDLVAAPLYWLPRQLDRYLGAAAQSGAERYVTTALAAHLAAGGVVRAVHLHDRIEVTTADDAVAAEQALRRPAP
ncbi:MAG: NTP transferase domain-containing protein [bacterium]